MNIYEIITKIVEQRKKENRIPHCAMIRDVIDLSGLSAHEVKEEAEKLKTEGKIAIKETINSYSFYLL